MSPLSPARPEGAGRCMWADPPGFGIPFGIEAGSIERWFRASGPLLIAAAGPISPLTQLDGVTAALCDRLLDASRATTIGKDKNVDWVNKKKLWERSSRPLLCSRLNG